MKEYAILIPALLTLNLAASQAQPASTVNSKVKETNFIEERIREYRNSINEQPANLVKYSQKNIHWFCTDLAVDTKILSNEDKSIVFLGNPHQKSADVWIRQGTGICRIINGPNTIYYYGGWKNDFQHGEGLISEINKPVLYGNWRYGKPVVGTFREATDEEKEKLSKYIRKIDWFISCL